MTQGIIEKKSVWRVLRLPEFLSNVLAPGNLHMLSMDRPNVSYARLEGATPRIAEALRLAHQVDALLEEAAKDPSVDKHAVRMAQGLARSLIVELGERPASEPRLTNAGLTGPARVA
jgi:hypothetical protein